MQLPPRFSQPISSPGNTTSTSQPRRLLCLCAALFLTFAAALAHAQDYTSIVVFGDSLSDTGNFADLTQAKYLVRIPGPDVNYTDGRFTDGDDTLPAAQKYFGVWIEQFAALLPSKPPITNSLNGGTNYAYGSPSTSTTLASRSPIIWPALPQSAIRLSSLFGAAPTTCSMPPPRATS
jgi:phospholipase/lecithinase/hemolysin